MVQEASEQFSLVLGFDTLLNWNNEGHGDYL